MDGDFFSTCLSEDDDIQFDDDLDPDDYAQDGERCGICMDVVIDRGVLDCCEHWFCFLCIDNWATITNLCPLCQNEFQSITCVPVYDTIGSSKGTEESGSRDDEWSIEEKNNTLSFPSYYIDENAVVCLDGDGCKLQSGLEFNSEDQNMDTSIACDSCDLWYHAFCVGFDTNNTSENTWLCPRCTGDEPHKSSGASMNDPGGQLYIDHTKAGYCVESSLSSKVSVSIADTGETAVVVSMVTENQWGESSKENSLSKVEVDASVCSFDVGFLEGDPSINDVHQNSELFGLEHSIFLEPSRRGLPNLVVKGKSEEEIFDKVTDDRSSFTEAEGKFETSLYCASSVKSGDDIVVRDRDEEITIVSHVKRKVRDCSTENIVTTPDKEIKSEVEIVRDSSKRPRTDENIEMISSLETETCLISDDSTRNLHSKTGFNDQRLRQGMHQGEKTDIMSSVKDLARGHFNKVVIPNNAHNDASEGGKESGKRVKKIMRRSAEDKDSSVLLQRLRQEIREAVQNKSTKDVGELFNPKLLAAFRAAVAGPKPVQNQKLSSSALKMKKSLLQKGKVRENLTKKIYATSNGRRKRAWDRDCEIEFWKHRCLQTSKPEKIETLKSVLGLLRCSSEDPETGKLLAPTDANPILSRLYLADTSIFPRNDNIRPVVALHGADSQHMSEKEQTSEPSSAITSFLKPLGGDSKPEGGTGKAYPPVVTDKGVNRFSSLKGPNTYNGVLHTKLKGSGTSQTNASEPSSQNKVVGQLDIKSDKRRWALEVLARKTAQPGQIITSHEHLEDTTLFKGNYPILAQLPVDMRPTPTHIRRNKIPMHVRQTQLYRLTEHLLKQANLPAIRRTAAAELAVADAVNIEKEIAERSNSKLVYVNLCSQEVLRNSDCSTTNSETAGNLDPIFPSADSAKEQTNKDAASDPTVEEALKNAGLLPESPPGSPRIQKDVPHGVDGASNKMKEDRPDNALEINSHSDLDLSGGFGYPFDHEDNNDVADAVNIQKGIAGRSNSKLVYVDLCSHEVLRHSMCRTTNSKTAVNLEPILPSIDSAKEQTNKEAVSDPSVEETLKNAGLLPESLPGSPRNKKDVTHGVDGSSNKMKDEWPDNVLEINSHSDLDISSGFGSALDREDQKDVNGHVVATRIVKGERKVNVILSPSPSVVAEKNEQNVDNTLAQSLAKLPSCHCSIKSKNKEHCQDSAINLEPKEYLSPPKIPVDNGRKETSTAGGEEFDVLNTEPRVQPLAVGSLACEKATEDGVNMSKDRVADPVADGANHLATGVLCHSAEACSVEPSKPDETIKEEEKKSDVCSSVSKKVEAFIKEHIRPLCKSGVITVEQYRWAVTKTTQKVMKYHSKDKNANFLIKEGEKVKKLALQYLEGSQKTE